VLTFNLVTQTAAPLSASYLGARLAPLDKALKHWTAAADDESHTEPAIYMLEHKYTDASISLQSLKGPDLARARALQHFAGKRGIELYLASMEKWVHGDADDDYYGGGPFEMREEFLSSLELKRVVDINGHELARNVEIDEDDLLQEEPYDTREPDERDHEGCTGNAGATTTHWYRDTVLVIGKRSQHVLVERPH
jgi:hypothetical protein